MAQKVQNKKQTQVGGPGNPLELFKIDLDELQAYLRKLCQAATTIKSEKINGNDAIYVVVQGKFFKEIEEVLVRRYRIPKTFIEIENKIPDSKKKKKK